jgi:hypothetical protein
MSKRPFEHDSNFNRASGEREGTVKQGPSRAWIWYFVILVVLTLLSITALVMFNLGQQLKPEQLAQAQALWNDKGPRDYNMVYTLNGSTTGTYRVQVRQGKVVSVIRDGQSVEKRLYVYSSMPALFEFIEDFLKQDAEPGRRRTFTKAVFDPQDGHLKHYVRRVMGTTERQEITVELTPVADDDPV